MDHHRQVDNVEAKATEEMQRRQAAEQLIGRANLEAIMPSEGGIPEALILNEDDRILARMLRGLPGTLYPLSRFLDHC